MNIVPIPWSEDKKKEAIGYLYDKFWQSVTARTNQVDQKYLKWIKNYDAQPKEATRTTPFFGASNFMPQLIRMHTDILSARLTGLIFSAKPMWKPKAFSREVPHDWLEALADWMEYLTFYRLGLFEQIDQTISRMIKTGTVVLKAPWVEESVFLGGERERVLRSEGVKVAPIPFDDFFPYPLNVGSLADVRIKFHRIRLTKEDVEFRKASNLWDSAACDQLLQSPEDPSKRPAESQKATSAGVQLTVDTARPFTAVESWLEYPITNDSSKSFRIVVVFNPLLRSEKGLLRHYFNYYSDGSDPFIDFRYMPREDFFFGYSMPEVLEQSQEEQAHVHNSRRDTSLITNIPGWKKKKYAQVNPAAEWYPGKVWELENLDDLEVVQFQPTYNSMLEEEKQVESLAERYSGISPPMQGFGAGVLSGKRGIYNSGGTLALLAEGNRRLDIYIKRFRHSFHLLGRCLFSSHRDFNGEKELQRWSKQVSEGQAQQAQFLRQVFELKDEEGQHGLYFDIGASDASANREIDRTSLLLMANTMAGYYRQIVEMAGMLAQVPEQHPMRALILAILDGAKDLNNRLLFAFDIGDRSRILPDVQKILGGQSQGRPQPPQQTGMPGAEGSVSIDQLSALQSGLASLTGGDGQGGGELPGVERGM
jgi:hypothetical protein